VGVLGGHWEVAGKRQLVVRKDGSLKNAQVVRKHGKGNMANLPEDCKTASSPLPEGRKNSYHKRQFHIVRGRPQTRRKAVVRENRCEPGGGQK